MIGVVGTHPSDRRVRGVRVDVEAAYPDHSPIDQGREARLAGTIESIPSAGPLLGESTHEPQSGLLALGHQRGEGLGRQLAQALDDHGHGSLTQAPPRRRLHDRGLDQGQLLGDRASALQA